MATLLARLTSVSDGDGGSGGDGGDASGGGGGGAITICYHGQHHFVGKSSPSLLSSFLKLPLVSHLRITFLQAGSSISILVFLFFIKVVTLHLLSHPSAWLLLPAASSSFSSSSATTSSSNPLLLAQQERQRKAEFLMLQRQHEEESERWQAVSKEELERSLRALQTSPECARLLKCLNYSLEVSVKSVEDREGCRRSYVRCGELGLLEHLNKLLRALDERAA